jgi:GAF domain-containing protein
MVEGAVVPDDSSLAETLAGIAQMFHEQAEIDGLLRVVVLAARDTVPGAEDAGVSLAHSRGRVETVAATGPRVYQIDTLQYSLGEGPCLDALRGSEPVASALVGETRWPAYTARVRELGVGAHLAVPLPMPAQNAGSLNLYGTGPAFPDEAVRIATLFAAHAAQALRRALTEQQLAEAVSMRKSVGQAVGIVMERYRLTEQQAFTYLVRLSQATNIKLYTLATSLIDDTDRAANGIEPTLYRPRPDELDGRSSRP